MMAAAGRPLEDEEVAAAVAVGAQMDGLAEGERCSLEAFLRARTYLMERAAGLH
jgi:hypothetical protein